MTSDFQTQVPAGWYSDKNDSTLIRFWDGSSWTRHTAPSNFNSEDQYSNAKAALQNEIDLLKKEVINLKDQVLLQDFGYYEMAHPLDDSVKYKERLEQIKEKIKYTLRSKNAVSYNESWSVNGSAAQGRKLAADFGNLMLYTYNQEVDDLVRAVRPYRLEKSTEKLNATVEKIERLGKMLDVKIDKQYHQLRLSELKLTSDYVNLLAQEKEEQKLENEKLREERKVAEELARKRALLDNERLKIQRALEIAIEHGDEEALVSLNAKKEEISVELEKVEHRAANIKSGYVYVISNIGAFGESVVKIGMTRRNEPMDRVRELGDASVPFRFDVHALFFSENATDIETKAHQYFAKRSVNKVNMRKEFFNVTPKEVLDFMHSLNVDILSFNEYAPADEYRQSLKLAGQFNNSKNGPISNKTVSLPKAIVPPVVQTIPAKPAPVSLPLDQDLPNLFDLDENIDLPLLPAEEKPKSNLQNPFPRRAIQ